LVTDRDYVRLERLAAELGLDLLGFYHSHPDHPSRPSRTDLEHAFPWFSYVIVAIERGVPSALTSWVLEEDRSAFRVEAIERTAGPSGPEPTAEGASPCHES
ncbi:MAG: Mov34/MPN/PAD-1 family protein, partial [Phycisphaerales bacterium]|nr:Mov34/MPN/PAD-1 family protein [Phycisphaerales bacterium]